MAMKARTVVGLDVHARQTHAAILDPASGEVRVSKLRMAPEDVVPFLAGLGPNVVAVYEAGPTGFGLARAGRDRGVDVRVAAPGSIPKRVGDRVKADRRTRSAWCACWRPASFGSRSSRPWWMSTSAIWCAPSRISAAI